MRLDAIRTGARDLKRTLLPMIYPALRRLPPARWDEVLQEARDTSFDTVEWAVVLGGIALVTYLLRFDADLAAEFAWPVRTLIQFFAAIPLLILVVGPFHLRRTRRGLEQALERRLGPRPPTSQR